MIRISSLLFTLAAVAAAADQTGLYSVNERKNAPDFVLQDASGKTARLKKYRH
ncbi:MAG: hypothetical protein JWO48_300, partial [Bryobacterales bacterium]|nr:hypothetical protein [Bryobacterales bacterium]